MPPSESSISSSKPRSDTTLLGFVPLVRSATTEIESVCTKSEYKAKQMHKEMRHRILAWKTQMWEKPRQRTGCRKYHYMRGIHCRGNAEATTSRPLLRHTRRRLHRGGNDLSLSHALSHTLCTPNFTTIQQHLEKLCPKSYLYLYDFRHIYISVLPIGSVPIKAGSAVSRFSASCIRFHSVPSGGTCFPTTS